MELKNAKESLNSLIQDFVDLGETINQLIQSVNSNELHDVFAEGYPKYLPSFDEFVFDIALWQKKIEASIGRDLPS